MPTTRHLLHRVASLVFLTVTVSLFQGCGSLDSAKPPEGTTQQSSGVDDDQDPDLGNAREAASPKWILGEWDEFAKIGVYFDKVKDSEGPLRLNVEINQEPDRVVTYESALFAMYAKAAPVRAHLSSEPNGFDLLFLNDNKQTVMSVTVTDSLIKIHWVTDLIATVSRDEFNAMTQETDMSLVIGKSKIAHADTLNPTVTLLVPDPGCTSSQHLKDGECVANIKSCPIEHGAGIQTWNATSEVWGSCEIETCEPGYVKDAPGCVKQASGSTKPRVLVSTDIGGEDPDDFQSMVHFLVYADRFDIEGLVSSPPLGGRKADILTVINAYEKDYSRLNSHASFPRPSDLRAVTKQGHLQPSPKAGYSNRTEGSDWIIRQAMNSDPRPLYLLVWGSATDLAQALHDEPLIKKKLRVYYIGGWNTTQDPNSMAYVKNNHRDLWMIESNTTFPGMFLGGNQTGELSNETFASRHVKGHGALGNLYYQKRPALKMGDTPSVLYLLNGNPNDPTGSSWGGTYVKSSFGPNWWTDDHNPSLTELNREGELRFGAKTVNRHRANFLRDWQQRMDWVLP